MKARVYVSSTRNFECKILENKERVMACAKGNLLKEGSIVVGDYVELTFDGTDEYYIESVYPRDSEIFRQLPRVNRKKITASNCDLMVIVMSADHPQYKQGILDRFLIRAYQWGIRPLLILNKMDLYTNVAFDLEYELLRVKEVCSDVILLSCLAGEFQNNLEELRRVLQDKTAIFMGQSGVGKSKIISTLSGGTFELKSGEVGKANKGKHTTTWIEMVDFPNFTLLDSPGVRSFALDDLSPNMLLECFPDIHKISLECRFSNCSHDPDAKGCAFFTEERAPNEMLHSRLDSYQRILIECSQLEEWQKK